MESITVHLYKAGDSEEAYALSIADQPETPWKAERGYGSSFQKVWSVELQAKKIPDFRQVDWDAVLERVIEAYDLNDPVITDFSWPMRLLA